MNIHVICETLNEPHNDTHDDFTNRNCYGDTTISTITSQRWVMIVKDPVKIHRKIKTKNALPDYCEKVKHNHRGMLTSN